MRYQYFILSVLTLLSVLSCDYRSLVDPVNTHYVRIYLDEQIKNVTTDFYDETYPRPVYRAPAIFRAALCDPASGQVVSERFLRGQGSDSRGNYVYGYISCDPGEYSLIAYNFDTEATVIRDERNCYDALAYTGLEFTKAKRIHNSPDHLFVARENVSFGYTSSVDTLLSTNRDYLSASSIVESWFVQIGVRNLRYASSVNAVISGLSGEKTLWSEAQGVEAVSISTEMSPGRTVTKGGSDTDEFGYIYAVFNTFGHLKDAASSIFVTFTVGTSDGRTDDVVFDITGLWDTEDAVKHNWLLIDEVIDVPKPINSEGGFRPGVGRWEDLSSDIYI